MCFRDGSTFYHCFLFSISGNLDASCLVSRIFSMKIAFADLALPAADTLILPVLEGQILGKQGKALDKKLSGQLVKAMTAADFSGKSGDVLTLPAPVKTDFTKIILLGFGKADKITDLSQEKAGAKAVTLLGGAAGSLLVDQFDGITLSALSLATGARLRAYRFDTYRTVKKPEDKGLPKSLTLLTAEATAARKAFAAVEKVVDGVFTTRDLVSEPANILYPASMADRCKPLEKLGVEVEILDEKKLAKLGMGSLLGVAQGSERPARVVVMRYMGDPKAKDKRPLAFIGKGVTFDTGGISIKPAAGMEDMKFDMGGAGAVIGLMQALAGRKAKVNAVGLIGLVENMPSGTAQRPGDVVKSLSGQTIEVINTDAEGRLVLADVVTYCQDTVKPRLMIDLATLTGAIVVALGHHYAGLFSTDDTLANQILKAGKDTGEELWRMPLNDAYDKEIDSAIADMKNMGSGKGGGSAIGAHFIKRFVKDGTPWAHLDIAGTAWANSDSGVTPKGASGFGVRLLDRFVRDNFEAV
jgi:leucyl aminopeptidase